MKTNRNSLVPVRQIIVVLAVLIFALGLPLAAQAQGAQSREAGLRVTLEIVTKARSQTFEAEVASTREQRAQGLMFRTELPERHGMLFDFGSDQEIRMWMKNTLIPLDMIFIKSDGHIVWIEQNAEPESLRLISSGGPARFVLEAKAGTATRFGIAVGDRVTLPVDR